MRWLFHGPHPLPILIYQDCFTVSTVPQSQPCAHILLEAAECISAFDVALVKFTFPHLHHLAQSFCVEILLQRTKCYYRCLLSRVWTIRRQTFHYSDIITTTRASYSTATRLFLQPYLLANIKENINARVPSPLWEESTGGRGISLTKGQ